MIPLLTLIGLLPLLGAAAMLLPIKEGGKPLAFIVSLATLALAVSATVVYVTAGPTALVNSLTWIEPMGASWTLAVDGMGLTMVLLTAVMTPVVMIAEWSLPEKQGRWGGSAFFGLLLLVEGLCLFVFMAQDLLVFYLLFEATLIPMYFLIGQFGTGDSAKAALKFLLFGLAGGLVMLVPVIGLCVQSRALETPSFLISELAKVSSGTDWSMGFLICFLIAFGMKAPMVPAHTWLPTAAESATPGSSVMMVGIMDKLGTFGMIAVCLKLFPAEMRLAAPVMLALALISILYGALAAIGSKNLMRLVAYTSISHFGFMVLGIFSFTATGISGTMFYMVNHGLSTGALFLVLGFLCSRRGSALVDDFGGVQKIAPVLSGALLLAGLSGLALPGMSTFISEFMVLAGEWSVTPWIAAIAALGTVLAAVYILLMYQKTMTGPVTDEVAATITTDLGTKEKVIAFGLVAVILVLGFAPNIALNVIQPTADALAQFVAGN